MKNILEALYNFGKWFFSQSYYDICNVTKQVLIYIFFHSLVSRAPSYEYVVIMFIHIRRSVTMFCDLPYTWSIPVPY